MLFCNFSFLIEENIHESFENRIKKLGTFKFKEIEKPCFSAFVNYILHEHSKITTKPHEIKTTAVISTGCFYNTSTDVIMWKTFSCQIISTQIDARMIFISFIIFLLFYETFFVDSAFIIYHSPTSKMRTKWINFVSQESLARVELFVNKVHWKFLPHRINQWGKFNDNFINDLTGGL